MAEQAEAQIELARLRDKEARAEYNDQAVYLGLIGRMQQEGLYYASLAHIDAYQKRYGANAEIRLMRADALRETGQDEAATLAYRELVSTDRAARAYHGLGLIAGRQDDFAHAVMALRQAAALDPINAQIANDLGYALMRGGALQEARVPVMQALQLDGSNPRIVSNAAVWMLADGKRTQANAMMQQANLPEATRTAIRKEADRVTRAAAGRAGTRPAASKPLAMSTESRSPNP
ncbi:MULTISPECIES: tetratricopeptide repeat protein [unclassified Cupriavidus]|uniref:pilus assembly protein TadD n=1 Tax=Cupriavidus sp. H19C3 TaxID=3241603 RepID=UPI003BF92035